MLASRRGCLVWAVAVGVTDRYRLCKAQQQGQPQQSQPREAQAAAGGASGSKWPGRHPRMVSHGRCDLPVTRGLLGEVRRSGPVPRAPRWPAQSSADSRSALRLHRRSGVKNCPVLVRSAPRWADGGRRGAAHPHRRTPVSGPAGHHRPCHRAAQARLPRQRRLRRPGGLTDQVPSDTSCARTGRIRSSS